MLIPNLWIIVYSQVSCAFSVCLYTLLHCSRFKEKYGPGTKVSHDAYFTLHCIVNVRVLANNFIYIEELL